MPFKSNGGGIKKIVEMCYNKLEKNIYFINVIDFIKGLS